MERTERSGGNSQTGSFSQMLPSAVPTTSGPAAQCGLCGAGCPVPVLMVSCGHRFCLGCLESFWQQISTCDRPCPSCTSRVGCHRPASPQQQPALCDVCTPRSPCSARWSCLTCGESYCPEHFQSHMLEDDGGQEGGLSGHRVCDAASDEAKRMREMRSARRRCREHTERAVELYCVVCRVCVCTLCPLLGTHRGHPVTLIQQEAQHKKILTSRCLDQLDQKRNNILANIGKIEQAVADLKNYTAAEKEMQAQMSPAEQWHPIPIKFEHVDNYFSSFMESVKSSLKKPLQKRLQKNMFSSLSVTANRKPGSFIKTKLYAERSLFLKHARCPTLDPDTMHSKLRLSEDRLTVHCSWIGRFNSYNPQRFDKLLQVMSRDSYFSGSHYWEVDVLQAGEGWWIGISYPSIQRKGDSEFSRLGWNSASWCIKRYDCEYWAFHKGERTPLHLEKTPERIGIFLDYESGVLSFFDVSHGMKHLHTFCCKFTEPLYPALRLWDGSITMCKLT
ncbi:tripartite motif-containing protein 14 [Bombina bombina]|uniref:tripartite motif-containing protein 14 n=1 Tax=Bombina bombina TaxID=8345 RepID=UPI00235A5016|nr:tripartite motif-containing protein 14 [Bombina bombina]